MAIKSGDTLLIQQALKTARNINDIDQNGASLLMHLAYETGNLALVRQMVKQGASLQVKGVIWKDLTGAGDFYGNLTGIAAAAGNVQLLKYLIEEKKLAVDDKEYDPQTGNFDGWTALQWACSSFKPPPGEYVIDKQGWDNYHSYMQVLKYLISKGAQINIGDKNGSPPLLLLLSNTVDNDALYLFVKANANMAVTDNQGRNALHFLTAYTNGFCFIETFFTAANPNQKNLEGFTPYMLAVQAEYECYHQLHELKPDLDLQNNDGMTALMLAVQAGRYYDCERLLSSKANCGLKNKKGETAMALAIISGNRGIIELLKKHKCAE
ncbi:MAG: ankyrin repeat domain-containing protein [Saprospiraceae bacterium]|nr:ankyrin repeat domain-containing protein [Saprospiraceae bacterium]